MKLYFLKKEEAWMENPNMPKIEFTCSYIPVKRIVKRCSSNKLYVLMQAHCRLRINTTFTAQDSVSTLCKEKTLPLELSIFQHGEWGLSKYTEVKGAIVLHLACLQTQTTALTWTLMGKYTSHELPNSQTSPEHAESARPADTPTGPDGHLHSSMQMSAHPAPTVAWQFVIG